MESDAAPSEEESRRRAFASLRDSDAARDDVLEPWRRGRARRFECLAEMRQDRAEDRLMEEVREVEARLDALEDGADEGPCVAAREALELGERSRWLLWLSGALAGEPSRDPLSFVEDELRWIERSAR